MKGFVGPLGDDIPGIFPIVLGVVLFVSSLLYANTQVQNTNNQLNLRSAGLSLSYVISQNAYLTSSNFQTDCKNTWQPYAKNLNLKFIIVVKTYCQQGINFTENPFIYCEDFNSKGSLTKPSAFISNNQMPYYTCYSNDSTTINVFDNVTGKFYSNEIGAYLPSNAVILSFPIAVNCPTTASILANSLINRCDYATSGSMTYGVGTLNIIVWR